MKLSRLIPTRAQSFSAVYVVVLSMLFWVIAIYTSVTVHHPWIAVPHLVAATAVELPLLVFASMTLAALFSVLFNKTDAILLPIMLALVLAAIFASVELTALALPSLIHITNHVSLGVDVVVLMATYGVTSSWYGRIMSRLECAQIAAESEDDTA